MQDWRSVRGALLRGSPVEVVVEDGFDRAVSARADVDGALGGGFKALRAIRTGQPDDPQTGAKALFRVPTLFEDQFTQRRSRRADQAGVGADALNRPPPQLKIAMAAGFVDIGRQLGDAIVELDELRASATLGGGCEERPLTG